MKLEKRSHFLEKKSKSPKNEQEDKSKNVSDSSTNKPKRHVECHFSQKQSPKMTGTLFDKILYDVILHHFVQGEFFSSW